MKWSGWNIWCFIKFSIESLNLILKIYMKIFSSDIFSYENDKEKKFKENICIRALEIFYTLQFLDKIFFYFKLRCKVQILYYIMSQFDSERKFYKKSIYVINFSWIHFREVFSLKAHFEKKITSFHYFIS